VFYCREINPIIFSAGMIPHDREAEQGEAEE
jgi:hypothetical protein